MKKLYRDRDWLWEHYIVQEKSSYVMAQEAGCGNWAICHWLHRYGIPVRSRGEGIFLAKRNFLTLSPRLLKLLGGELTSDGCVRMNGNRSARYQHSSALEEYLAWLSGRFGELGIEQVGRITDHVSKKLARFITTTPQDLIQN